MLTQWKGARSHEDKNLFLWLAGFHGRVRPIAEAQQPAKIFRIGVLSSRSTMEPRDEVFRQRLRELGYVEGKNLVIEWRFYDGQLDRLNSFAAELVRLKVDVIFGTATPTIQAAKKATTTIAIVMTAGADLAESGIVSAGTSPG